MGSDIIYAKALTTSEEESLGCLEEKNMKKAKYIFSCFFVFKESLRGWVARIRFQ
jgi:hypothetical protein